MSNYPFKSDIIALSNEKKKLIDILFDGDFYMETISVRVHKSDPYAEVGVRYSFKKQEDLLLYKLFKAL